MVSLEMNKSITKLNQLQEVFFYRETNKGIIRPKVRIMKV